MKVAIPQGPQLCIKMMHKIFLLDYLQKPYKIAYDLQTTHRFNRPSMHIACSHYRNRYRHLLQTHPQNRDLRIDLAKPYVDPTTTPDNVTVLHVSIIMCPLPTLRCATPQRLAIFYAEDTMPFLCRKYLLSSSMLLHLVCIRPFYLSAKSKIIKIIFVESIPLVYLSWHLYPLECWLEGPNLGLATVEENNTFSKKQWLVEERWKKRTN
jgi:hypothetical protein